MVQLSPSFPRMSGTITFLNTFSGSAAHRAPQPAPTSLHHRHDIITSHRAPQPAPTSLHHTGPHNQLPHHYITDMTSLHHTGPHNQLPHHYITDMTSLTHMTSHHYITDMTSLTHMTSHHIITSKALGKGSYAERHTTKCKPITRDECAERPKRQEQFLLIGIPQIRTWAFYK